jgi:hypothetical protein
LRMGRHGAGVPSSQKRPIAELKTRHVRQLLRTPTLPKKDQMKTIRLLIPVFLALSLALGAAPAGAAGASMGYIALVTRPAADPQTPVALQAAQAYDELAPALLAAQQSGYIADFRPELAVGIVMVRFGSTVGAASLAAGMLGVPVYGSSRDALNQVPQQPQASGGVSATAISASFNVYLFDSCFSGSVPVNSHIIAVLRDPSGNVVAKTELNEQDDGSSDGSFSACFDSSTQNEVDPGYKVTFKVYDTAGGTQLGAFTSGVPNIKFKSVNKTNAVISGTATAGKHFCIGWSQPRLDSANSYATNNTSTCGTVNSSSQWSGDVSSGTIRGGAYLDLVLRQTSNIKFTQYMFASYIWCQLRGVHCAIYGFPFQSALLNVTHSGVVYKFTGSADAHGRFPVELRNHNGLPFITKPGDKVSGTDVATYSLPAISINTFDFTNDIVSGKAPASRYFSLFVSTYSHGQHTYWAKSNSSGNFSVDTSAYVDLVGDETSQAELTYVDRSTGNTSDVTRAYVP